MKVVRYLLVKLPSLTDLNLDNKIGSLGTGSIVRNIVKVLNHYGNNNIVLYHEDFKGANA